MVGLVGWGGGGLAINNLRTRPLINSESVTQKSKSGRVDLFKRSKEHVCDGSERKEKFSLRNYRGFTDTTYLL